MLTPDELKEIFGPPKPREPSKDEDSDYEWATDTGYTKKGSGEEYGECRWDSQFD